MAGTGHDEEPRVRRLLIAARRGLEPWVSTPPDRLKAVADQYAAADVAETIAEMDILSRARADVPAWDGDAHDGIGSAQEVWTRILGQVDGALLTELAGGLRGGEVETRRWVTLAIEMHGAPAIRALRDVLNDEQNPDVRRTITEALERLQA